MGWPAPSWASASGQFLLRACFSNQANHCRERTRVSTSFKRLAQSSRIQPRTAKMHSLPGGTEEGGSQLTGNSKGNVRQQRLRASLKNRHAEKTQVRPVPRGALHKNAGSKACSRSSSWRWQPQEPRDGARIKVDPLEAQGAPVSAMASAMQTNTLGSKNCLLCSAAAGL